VIGDAFILNARFRAGKSVALQTASGRYALFATLASNGMDAPTLTGIDVPQWKCRTAT